EVGGIIKRFAFTEFSKNDSDKRISLITNENEFTFQFLNPYEFKDSIKLFSSGEYVVYYFPNGSDKLEYSNNPPLKKSNPKSTIYKNNFPIFVYKKSLD
ncbi:MAG: hypothetical protein KDK36_09125, partial [Leptospiraceae bacterium]|nr:hypothetical protein [Leptospiraceae bacterium]